MRDLNNLHMLQLNHLCNLVLKYQFMEINSLFLKEYFYNQHKVEYFLLIHPLGILLVVVAINRCCYYLRFIYHLCKLNNFRYYLMKFLIIALIENTISWSNLCYSVIFKEAVKDPNNLHMLLLVHLCKLVLNNQLLVLDS
jgi:hypothetical protein